MTSTTTPKRSRCRRCGYFCTVEDGCPPGGIPPIAMPDGSPSELMLEGWVPPEDDEEYEEPAAEPEPPMTAAPKRRRQVRSPGEPIVIEADREKHKIRMKRYHLRKKLRADRVPEDEIERRLAKVGLAPEGRQGDDDTVH